MSWHLVDGVPLPDPVGGHPALDFCNTRAGWSSTTPKEYLTSPHALALWAVDAGLVRPDSTLPGPDDGARADAADWLRRALDLREALYACLRGHGTSADWALVTQEVVAARSVSRLRPAGPDGDGRARWELDVGTLGPERAAVHAAAGSAELLLTSTLAGCVAACPGVGCGWLFADPRLRRRWCSMAVCGNRAKARRYAARRAPDPGARTLSREGDHTR
jgi:predicted RNA-binding Zn ribbon-like protein